MSWWNIGIIGLLAGVGGTGLGACFILFSKQPGRRLMGTVMAFSAGVMLAIVFLELLEEALNFGGAMAALSGLLLGLVVFYALDYSLPHQHAVSQEEAHRSGYAKKGVLLALGIALHNLPEGLAIGVGFIGSAELGMTLALLIALHNVPEGMAVAYPLFGGGYSRGQSIALTALSGVPMGLGALIGAFIGAISPLILGISFSFAAGAMLYIVCDELIPDAYQSAGAHYSIAGIFSGVILGLLWGQAP